MKEVRDTTKIISPSRTYVVFIYATWVKDISRIIPAIVRVPDDHENTASHASWYYLNRMDAISVVESLILTKEEFDSIKTPV